MSRMTKKNLQSIKNRFSEKTGTALPEAQALPPVRKLAVLAAALAAFLVLTAFAWPMFSSLDGDELSLQGTYEGAGIVTVRVENRSDKKLRFQKQAKLMRWVNAEEVPGLGGEVKFENTEFEPHSDGSMYLDLSEAYDVQALEQSKTNDEWFYLVLTNNNFLFGQDWMCSIRFSLPEENPENPVTAESIAVEPEILAEIREELRFYFEESYSDTLMAFNEANFLYQQKIKEVLARFDGKIVPSLSPRILVGGPTEFLQPEPVLKPDPEEGSDLKTEVQWRYTDGFGRMVAAKDEKAWLLSVLLPSRSGQTDGTVPLPVCFLFVYDAREAQPENYAFIYGRLCSFAELEACLVLRDEHYAIYDAAGLFCREPDAYLDAFLAANPDVSRDGEIREMVHKVWDRYKDREALADRIGYLWFTE